MANPRRRYTGWVDSRFGPDIDTNPLTKRKCRVCQAPLRASRYFRCALHSGDSVSNNTQNYTKWAWDDWGYASHSIKERWILG